MLINEISIMLTHLKYIIENIIAILSLWEFTGAFTSHKQIINFYPHLHRDNN